MTEPASGVIVRFFTRVRSLVGILIMIPYTIFCSVVVIAVSFLGLHELATQLIRGWAVVALGLFGIRLHVTGEENLPKKGGGIVVFNHQSLFDIPVLMFATAKNIRFGAKIELFKIPFFGAAMRACGTLPIARENRSEVMRVYKQAESRFARNTLFVLAPEGTRQREPIIGRFKKGPFIFALNARVPIVPVVLKGTHSVLPKKSLTVNIGRLRRIIYVHFLNPVPTTNAVPKEIDSLVDGVRAAMVNTYAQMPEDF